MDNEVASAIYGLTGAACVVGGAACAYWASLSRPKEKLTFTIYIIALYIIALMIWGCMSVARADTIEYRYYPNPHMTRAEFVSVAQTANNYLCGKTKRCYTIRIRDVAKDPCPQRAAPSSISERVSRLYCYRDFDRKQKIRRIRGKQIHVHASTALVWQGVRFLSGVAEKCKPNRGTAYVTLNTKNQLGEDRWMHSVHAIAHEVTHVNGAGHDDSGCNLMAEAALPCVVPHTFLPVTARTLGELRRCKG